MLSVATRLWSWLARSEPGSVALCYMCVRAATSWLRSPGRLMFLGTNTLVFATLSRKNFKEVHKGVGLSVKEAYSWMHQLDTLLDGLIQDTVPCLNSHSSMGTKVQYVSPPAPRAPRVESPFLQIGAPNDCVRSLPCLSATTTTNRDRSPFRVARGPMGQL